MGRQYNRYVDGLATWQPTDESMYTEMGKHLAAVGYKTPSMGKDSQPRAEGRAE